MSDIKNSDQAIQVYELPYELDCIGHYENFSHLEGFVLLESQDKRLGRYDIMTALPRERFIEYEDTMDNAFQRFNDWLPKQPRTKQALPFQGGGIGYLSYESGAIGLGIHPVGLRVHNPALPLMDMGLYDWAFVVDHFEKKTQLVVVWENSHNHAFAEDLLNRWHTQTHRQASFKLVTSFQPVVTIDGYQAAFYKIKKALQQGRAYQVNFTQPFVASHQGDPWEMYKRVRQKNPVPFAAYLSLSDHTIVSFSPERFLLKQGDSILTSPIKGSSKRVQSAFEDKMLQQKLLACVKNRAENTMIVDLMRNDLGKIAQVGSVTVERLCALQSFNSVHHLVSDIRAQLKPEIAICDILQACYPGGSITGAPKRESMKIISELECYQRHAYCGSIGYFSAQGYFDTNIAIRTLIAHQGKLHLSAGGGIVMDSVCEEEYQECYTKMAGITESLK